MSDLDYLLDSLREVQLNLNDCIESDLFVSELTELRELVNVCLDRVELLMGDDDPIEFDRQLKFPVLVESFEEE